MNGSQTATLSQLLAKLPDLLPALEEAYKDVHAHPELSMQETRTADIAAKHLAYNGYEVTTGIGKTGPPSHGPLGQHAKVKPKGRPDCGKGRWSCIGRDYTSALAFSYCSLSIAAPNGGVRAARPRIPTAQELSMLYRYFLIG